MQILFATSNPHKTAEVQSALPPIYTLLSISDIQHGRIEVEEPYDTLEENAAHKAKAYQQWSGMSCFSEDTGLEVSSLNGSPGVQSARYAGLPANDTKNIEKLMRDLAGDKDRRARFRTVIALVRNGSCYLFEGICPGQIIMEPRGQNGFGYDPVFIPDGSDKTFAEMTTEEKNLYSHRKKALNRLIEFLKQE